MNTRSMTLNEIQIAGIKALNEQLGMVGMIRFLQQHETGWGDYTQEREQWLGNPDLRELAEKIDADGFNKPNESATLISS